MATDRATRYRVKEDQPTLGLAAGDIVVCEPYRLDPDKRTVLYRELPDGTIDWPEVNQYRTDLERMDDALVLVRFDPADRRHHPDPEGRL